MEFGIGDDDFDLGMLLEPPLRGASIVSVVRLEARRPQEVGSDKTNEGLVFDDQCRGPTRSHFAVHLRWRHEGVEGALNGVNGSPGHLALPRTRTRSASSPDRVSSVLRPTSRASCHIALLLSAPLLVISPS